MINFKETLKQYNIELTDKQEKQFATYFNLILEYNKVMDLTSVADESIYERHFLNSLSIAFNKDFNGLSLCDVGAGAGFPSIPLKIVFPNMKLTIIDPLQKRMKFLEIVINKLELKDVNIVVSRVEDLKSFKESFDIVTARAVARLNILSELVSQIVKVNGNFIAMKGKQAIDELNEASNALKECRFELINKETFGESTNLFFKKIDHVSEKYPRNFGQISKKPL